MARILINLYIFILADVQVAYKMPRIFQVTFNKMILYMLKVFTPTRSIGWLDSLNIASYGGHPVTC